jgi:hypothetical protein
MGLNMGQGGLEVRLSAHGERHGLPASALHEGLVAGVARVCHQHLVTCIQDGQHGQQQGRRGPCGDSDLLRRHADLVSPPIIGCNGLSK